jgi:hypothetical protein
VCEIPHVKTHTHCHTQHLARHVNVCCYSIHCAFGCVAFFFFYSYSCIVHFYRFTFHGALKTYGLGVVVLVVMQAVYQLVDQSMSRDCDLYRIVLYLVME